MPETDRKNLPCIKDQIRKSYPFVFLCFSESCLSFSSPSIFNTKPSKYCRRQYLSQVGVLLAKDVRRNASIFRRLRMNGDFLPRVCAVKAVCQDLCLDGVGQGVKMLSPDIFGWFGSRFAGWHAHNFVFFYLTVLRHPSAPVSGNLFCVSEPVLCFGTCSVTTNSICWDMG